MAEVDIRTTGMHCHSCVMLIQMNVGEMPGVQSVDVDLASGNTHVVYDSEQVDTSAIVKKIEESGYGAEVASR